MNNPEQRKSSPSESPFANFLFNLILPTIILTKFSSPERLGPTRALLIALAFPLFYGLHDFWKNKKRNFISILGFISILLTGGLGLMKLGGVWFAVKEAAIPGLIGVFTLASLKTKYPIVEKLLLNDNLLHMDRIEQKLKETNNEAEFAKLMRGSTLLIALSFVISAVLNFVLAIWVLKSPSGTPEFNAELGYMNAISVPIILVSCSSILVYALWRLASQVRKLTGLSWDDILKTK